MWLDLLSITTRSKGSVLRTTFANHPDSEVDDDGSERYSDIEMESSDDASPLTTPHKEQFLPHPKAAFDVEIVTSLSVSEDLESDTGGGDYADDHYFARGEIQDPQFVCRCCSGFTPQEHRAKLNRIMPCFVSAPICSLKSGCPRIFSCCGQRFRCCSRVGNFTVRNLAHFVLLFFSKG